MSIIRPRVWTQQPQYPVGVDGAIFTYTPTTRRFALPSYQLTPSANEFTFAAGNSDIYAKATAGSTALRVLSPPTPDNTLDAATLIVVQRLPTTASNYGWHKFATDSINSHVAYSGNVYLSTFSSSRWLNGVVLPSGYNQTHVMIVRAKGTERKAWMCGKLLGTASSDSKVRWDSWNIGTPDATYYAGVETYALVLLPYAIPDARVSEISINPWQIFAPRVT